MAGQFADGGAYERFMGRWSRLVARRVVRDLDVPEGGAWADVGCGTGALTQTLLELCAPRRVVGLDPSPEQVSVARETVADARARFEVAGAEELLTVLDRAGGAVDAAVAALVLNFVPDPAAVVALMRDAAPGGVVAAYLWDAGGMAQLRLFEEAAAVVVPAARERDLGRLVLGRPDALEALWRQAGLGGVRTWPVDVPLVYRDVDELWQLFLSGIGPTGQLVVGLDEDRRARVHARLLELVPVDADGAVRLTARAWAVSGRA